MTANRRYAIEFSAAMIGYGIVLIGSIKLLGLYGETAWRYPMALAPVLPAAAALVAFVRFFRSVEGQAGYPECGGERRPGDRMS